MEVRLQLESIEWGYSSLCAIWHCGPFDHSVRRCWSFFMSLRSFWSVDLKVVLWLLRGQGPSDRRHFLFVLPLVLFGSLVRVFSVLSGSFSQMLLSWKIGEVNCPLTGQLRRLKMIVLFDGSHPLFGYSAYLKGYPSNKPKFWLESVTAFICLARQIRGTGIPGTVNRLSLIIISNLCYKRTKRKEKKNAWVYVR